MRMEFGGIIGGIKMGRGVERVEQKSVVENVVGAVVGYATRYRALHVGLKGQLEVFMPGCFSKSLASGSAIEFLTEHKNANYIADSNSGLEIAECDEGLLFRLSVPDSEMGRTLFKSVEDGSIDQMSIGYEVKDDEFVELEGHSIRMILEAALSEISAVKSGAVPGAFVQVAPTEEEMLERKRTRTWAIIWEAYPNSFA